MDCGDGLNCFGAMFLLMLYSFLLYSLIVIFFFLFFFLFFGLTFVLWWLYATIYLIISNKTEKYIGL